MSSYNGQRYTLTISRGGAAELRPEPLLGEWALVEEVEKDIGRQLAEARDAIRYLEHRVRELEDEA